MTKNSYFWTFQLQSKLLEDINLNAINTLLSTSYNAIFAEAQLMKTTFWTLGDVIKHLLNPASKSILQTQKLLQVKEAVTYCEVYDWCGTS